MLDLAAVVTSLLIATLVFLSICAASFTATLAPC